jgi:hypothetical protein
MNANKNIKENKMNIQDQIRAKRNELIKLAETVGTEKWINVRNELRALERQAEMIKQAEMKNEAYQDNKGVWRWKSNNRVPFEDMLESWNLDEETFKKCVAAREADDANFFANYRKQMENYEPDAETLYEMKAAFGEGAEVVNVITGKKIKL